jgi:HSP20 family protein
MTALRFDPFRELDRMANEMMGAARSPRLMPLDAYRHGESYVLQFDLPGIDTDSLDVTAERNTLTVQARRRATAPDGAQYVLAERPYGDYSRQIVLGDGLSLDAIDADYRDGVLTVTIPVAEQAKPRQIRVGRSADGLSGDRDRKVIEGQDHGTIDGATSDADSDQAGRVSVNA